MNMSCIPITPGLLRGTFKFQDQRLKRTGFLAFILIVGFGMILSSPVNGKEIKKIIKVPRVHIVTEGDNLWELSKENYQDPYKWRKVWGKNKFVTDPNLIFPGDQLLMPGQFVDKEVIQIIPDVKPETKQVEIQSKAKEPVPAVPLSPPDLDPISIVSDAVFLRSGYVTSDEKFAGSIIAGHEERSIYGSGDLLYADINQGNVSVGDRFTIVDSIIKIRHPVTGKKAGTLIQEVGALEIIEVRSDSSTGKVTSSYNDIEAGDLLIRKEDPEKPLRDLLQERTKKEIEGYIIFGKEETEAFGTGSIIYLDVGKEQGVSVSDRFIAYKKGDELKKSWFGKKKKTVRFPKTVYGKLEVFNARSKTSTAIVIESKKEINLGTRIEHVKN